MGHLLSSPSVCLVVTNNPVENVRLQEIKEKKTIQTEVHEQKAEYGS
jgi:hypothetical protein